MRANCSGGGLYVVRFDQVGKVGSVRARRHPYSQDRDSTQEPDAERCDAGSERNKKPSHDLKAVSNDEVRRTFRVIEYRRGHGI